LIEPFEFERAIPAAIARKNDPLKVSLGNAVRLKADDLLGLVELASKAEGEDHLNTTFSYCLEKVVKMRVISSHMRAWR
jgi:hypothetical protein